MYEEEKASTSSDRAISPDTSVLLELPEGGASVEFSLLQTGYRHLVVGQVVLQFCVAMKYTVEVEL